ncbi:MAG TPA: damage-inducible protein CinA, partial [Sulfitobacter sp.]|nr:damage-inducible protein CinA [Sulfitobacter sp.]
FGLATASGITTQTQEFGALGRDKVRRAARDFALGLIFEAIT